MKKLLWSIAMVLVAASVLAACGEATLLSPTPAPKGPATTGGSVSKAGWEEKWNVSLTRAKGEGAVTMYTQWLPNVRSVVGQAFKEKYGINLEFSPFVGGTDLLAKVQAEKRAGIYAADVFGTGTNTLLTTMKPEGLLGPVQPWLVLPEVLDTGAWFGGRLPFPDKDGLSVSMMGIAMHMVVYNTDLVKEREITTYKDLLKPQYKGKITMHDPSVTGSGNAAITNVGHYLWGEAQTADFLRKLITEQEVIILRDYRVQMESVAKGKYAVALAPNPEQTADFLALGAPIKIATVEEDTILTASAGAIGVPTQFAHPDAALVFVNWLLTREGQSALSKGFGNPSKRTDIFTEGINPLFIPQSDKKYYDGDTEESLAAKTRWREIAKKIMDETMKK